MTGSALLHDTMYVVAMGRCWTTVQMVVTIMVVSSMNVLTLLGMPIFRRLVQKSVDTLQQCCPKVYRG